MIQIVVALIGAVGLVVPAWLAFRRMRIENEAQHAQGYTLLQSIDGRVQNIDREVDGLSAWRLAHEEHHIHIEENREVQK